MLLKKDKSILFFSKSGFKVAELIFNFPTQRFHLRKIAREINLSTTAVTQASKELAKFGILKITKTPLTTEIRANLDSEEYRHYKQLFNLYRVNRYNLTSILVNELRAKCVVLFGSFARGEDTEKSDIDILVVSNIKKDINLSAYEKVLARKINLHMLKGLKKSSNEFRNEIANGIVLYGFLEVVE